MDLYTLIVYSFSIHFFSILYLFFNFYNIILWMLFWEGHNQVELKDVNNLVS